MSEKSQESALWTTSDVAKALGVGVSSVKRWTDEGALKSVKTLGGHRRYTVAAVHDFALGRGFDRSLLPSPITRSRSVDELRDDLLLALEGGNESEAREIVSHSPPRGVSRAEFLDRVVAPVMETIGHEWRAGNWSVSSEHRATNIVADALDRLRPDALPESAPVAMLACPPGDLHDLPLRMVRLVLEWNDWRTDYLGADVPFESLDSAVVRERPTLVLLTSRSPDSFASGEFLSLAERWTRLGVNVGAGGWWARGGTRRGDDLLRFRTLRGFERWLHSSSAQRFKTQSR